MTDEKQATRPPSDAPTCSAIGRIVAKLEFDAACASDLAGDCESGRLSMEAAGMIRTLHNAIRSFVGNMVTAGHHPAPLQILIEIANQPGAAFPCPICHSPYTYEKIGLGHECIGCGYIFQPNKEL